MAGVGHLDWLRARHRMVRAARGDVCARIQESLGVAPEPLRPRLKKAVATLLDALIGDLLRGAARAGGYGKRGVSA